MLSAICQSVIDNGVGTGVSKPVDFRVKLQNN